MPAISTGQVTVASGQILTCQDFLIDQQTGAPVYTFNPNPGTLLPNPPPVFAPIPPYGPGNVDGPSPGGFIRLVTSIPTENLRTILVHLYHFPEYTPLAPPAAPAAPPLPPPGALTLIKARLNIVWRPVFLPAPRVTQTTPWTGNFVPLPVPHYDPSQPGYGWPYEPINEWVPMLPPQLMPPGVPIYTTLSVGGVSAVAIEVSTVNYPAEMDPLFPGPSYPLNPIALDRIRIVVSAAA